jgi:hypothetical protein
MVMVMPNARDHPLPLRAQLENEIVPEMPVGTGDQDSTVG